MNKKKEMKKEDLEKVSGGGLFSHSFWKKGLHLDERVGEDIGRGTAKAGEDLCRDQTQNGAADADLTGG